MLRLVPQTTSGLCNPGDSCNGHRPSHARCSRQRQCRKGRYRGWISKFRRRAPQYPTRRSLAVLTLFATRSRKGPGHARTLSAAPKPTTSSLRPIRSPIMESAHARRSEPTSARPRRQHYPVRPGRQLQQPAPESRRQWRRRRPERAHRPRRPAHAAHQHRRRDAPLVPRLLDVRHHRSRPARRP